jgi:chromosomal replication initiator protein
MTLGSSSSLPDPDLPSDLGSSLWQGCVEQLAQELPEQQFNTWIKPLHAVAASDLSKLTILVGNRFKLDWIRAQYAARISALVEQLNGQPITVELALAPREPVSRSSFSKITTESEILPERFQAPEEPMSTGFRSRLNSALTFASLVEGTANRMARAAAMHVASIPGQLYNPLFIYGGVGLGKTHLMHAVGNKLLEDRPDAKVLYIHAEQFVSDVVKAYQRKTFDEFKAHYHSLDLLLIDDVQFFANKERTQEEFFNAFEALLATGLPQGHRERAAMTVPSRQGQRKVQQHSSAINVSENEIQRRQDGDDVWDINTLQ